jgi:hypothetical protein
MMVTVTERLNYAECPAISNRAGTGVVLHNKELRDGFNLNHFSGVGSCVWAKLAAVCWYRVLEDKRSGS